MDAIVPLLVLAIAVRAWLGRRVPRRDDVGRAVTDTVARLRRLAADAAVPTPPGPMPTPPAARSVPVVPVARVEPVAPSETIPPESVAPRPFLAPATTTETPAPTPTPHRAGRRRLAVGRDLVAAELLAAPVSLRRGGTAWR